MGRKLDRTTKVLLALRVASVLIPQYGYIHADEFFQSTEITAGDVLGTDSYRSWEFTTDKPIRSAFFVHLFAYIPYQLLRLTGHTAYLRLVLPRLVACFASFLVDAVAYRMGGSAAVKLTASSYIALTYFTRTFSNVTESILLSILILISFGTTEVFCRKKVTSGSADKVQTDEATKKDAAKDTGKEEQKSDAKDGKQEKKPEGSKDEAKDVKDDAKDAGTSGATCSGGEVCEFKRRLPQASDVLYAFVLAAGVFNRPTFLCFALLPLVSRYYTATFGRFVLNLIRLSILSVPACALFIATDSVYYRGLDAVLVDPLHNLVITPLNFVVYNSDPAKLASHGLHPFWLHFLVNLPLLFGAHALFLYCDFYRLLRKRQELNSESKTLVWTMLIPICVLSIFPHQEPRFLTPLLLPFVLRNATKLLCTRRSRTLWFGFNIAMFILYGFLHQASVVPTQMYSGIEGKVVYFHTYMPPRHLNPDVGKRNIVDLKEAPLEELESALRKHHDGVLVYPAGVEHIVATALQNVVCTVKDGSSLWPHVATEYLFSSVLKCRFNVICYFFDSLMLNRVRFQCESAL